MSIKIYKDIAANSIFIEDANGAQFINSLQASVPTTTVTITDLARQIDIVSNAEHTDFVDENDNPYTGTAIDVCNTLNAIFQSSGTPSNEVPVITSSNSINSVQGSVINYELTATNGVGYEWENLPTGITTVDGNVRKLIGGSNLVSGTYTPTMRAINYNGVDSETLTINISTPPFANTKSINFNNNDYLGANAALLDGILGRTGNGSGASDAWSVSYYFKAGSASNANQTLFYFGSQDVANNGYLQLKYDGSSNVKRLTIRYGTNNNRIEVRTPNNAVTVGQWHHVLMTYDGGTTGSSSGDINNYYSRFKIFVDGTQQTLTGSNSNFGYTGAISGQNLRVGRWNTGQSLRNNCRIDELAIFDSDQSGNISEIYNSGTPFDLSTLTTQPNHWWRMGDGDTYPNIQDNGTAANCVFVMTNMTSSDIVNDTP